MTDPIRTTPPATTPVTLFEAKAHLRVNHTDEDVLIESLIAAATEYLDGPTGILGRALVAQVWREDWGGFQASFPLRVGPVQNVVSVSYTDDAGSAQTVSGARVVVSGGCYSVHPATGTAWPSGSDVSIEYTAGYADVPAPLKAAILLHVGALYEHRESVSETALMPFAYEALITPYRRNLV